MPLLVECCSLASSCSGLLFKEIERNKDFFFLVFNVNLLLSFERKGSVFFWKLPQHGQRGACKKVGAYISESQNEPRAHHCILVILRWSPTLMYFFIFTYCFIITFNVHCCCFHIQSPPRPFTSPSLPLSGLVHSTSRHLQNSHRASSYTSTISEGIVGEEEREQETS